MPPASFPDLRPVVGSLGRLQTAFETLAPFLSFLEEGQRWRPSRRMKRMAVKTDRYYRRCERITGGHQAPSRNWKQYQWQVGYEYGHR